MIFPSESTVRRAAWLGPGTGSIAVSAAEVDAVWTLLIQQARTRDEATMSVCAGAALPMLHSITAVLCGHWIHRTDTEAMVIVGFLEALGELDVHRPNVAYRLRWATFHPHLPARVHERRAAPIPADWSPASDDLIAPQAGAGFCTCLASTAPARPQASIFRSVLRAPPGQTVRFVIAVGAHSVASSRAATDHSIEGLYRIQAACRCSERSMCREPWRRPWLCRQPFAWPRGFGPAGARAY